MKGFGNLKTLILLISALATWRISNILVHEDGPFDFAKLLRTKSGLVPFDEIPAQEQMFYEEDVEYIHNNEFFAKLLSCVWCTSVWVGTAISIYLGIFNFIDKKIIPIYAFALSALAIFLYKGENKWQ